MSEDWRDDALCAQVGPHLFFPGEGESPNRWPGADQARLICGDCPVRTACLQTAMRDERGDGIHHRAGMYGGLTPLERARLAGKAPSEGPTDPERAWKHGPETVDRIRDLYNAGAPIRDIAGELQLTQAQVKNLIRRHKLANRVNRSSAEVVARRDEEIRGLRASGLSRPQIANLLGITLAMVDNARRRRTAA